MKIYASYMARCLFLLTALYAIPYSAISQNAKHVDPFIGTMGHGHTYPGATAPFGMVQLSPDTDLWKWDWCSGYHGSDSSIIGFSHRHLSGTGAMDLGEILLMPITGKPAVEEWRKLKWWHGAKTNPDAGYRSRFSHDKEEAKAGYYRVYLDDYETDVELAATERVGFHKYSFKTDEEKHLLIDLKHQILGWRGKPSWSFFQIENDSTITGYKKSKGWANEKAVYFAIRLSEPIANLRGFSENKEFNTKILNGVDVKALLEFEKSISSLMVKVGISAVSITNAQENLEAEIPHWNFDAVASQTYAKWDKALSRINIDAHDTVKTIFYTGMYHNFLAPTVYQDVNGEYMGADFRTHKGKGFTNMTTFSLWDTYRATHPLYTYAAPERVSDMVNSMVAFYKEHPYHTLPIWPLMQNETWTMIGYHSIPVIADAYFKGIKGIDYEAALDAMVASAQADTPDPARRGKERYISFYMEHGYAAIDQEIEAASKTLEYAFDDWCIAQMANAMGKKEIAETFFKRANNYKNLYDPATKFMRAKKKDGTFRIPFDPFFAKYGGDYTEGNAWQYTWSVQHDPYGLIGLMGGNAPFEKKLDSLFIVEGPEYEDKPHDITGLIGQYAHGNEPSHHIGFFYNYIGKPWKTQSFIRDVTTSQYSAQLDGLSGNEDCGQMSAWYIFSAMGFYPFNPSSGVYTFGSPLINKGSIQTADGKTFEIEVVNNSAKNKYIKKITLDGVPYTKSYITHADIMAGKKLVITMSNKPNKKRGVKKEDLPLSFGF